MSNASGIISSPVNMKADVQYVLTGSTSGSVNLSALCTHANINRWAKYKPVKYASDAPNRSGEWWKAYNNGCGFEFNSGTTLFTDIIDMINAWIGKSGYDWESFWPYVPPTGGTYPYRLLDFNNYKHLAAKPWTTYSMPSSITRYYMDGAYTIGSNASVYANTDTTYALSVNDIKIPYGNGYMDMKSMYFGIAFVYNYTAAASSRQYAFQTCYCDWNTDATSDTHDGSYGKTIRMTPNFSTYSLPYNASYLALPFLSSIRFWDTGVYSGTAASNNPVLLQTRTGWNTRCIPLPYAGIVTTVAQQTISIQLSLTAQRTASGTLLLTMVAKNKTSSTQTLYQSLITYDVWVYPKNSNGVDYLNGHEYTATWGSSSNSIGGNGSVTLTKTINYTEYSPAYGGFITSRVYASVGYISSARATVIDY